MVVGRFAQRACQCRMGTVFGSLFPQHAICGKDIGNEVARLEARGQQALSVNYAIICIILLRCTHLTHSNVGGLVGLNFVEKQFQCLCSANVQWFVSRSTFYMFEYFVAAQPRQQNFEGMVLKVAVVQYQKVSFLQLGSEMSKAFFSHGNSKLYAFKATIHFAEYSFEFSFSVLFTWRF